MIERDERPLTEIRFAQDANAPWCEADVRIAFSRCGVQVAQDIIDLGCTGLVSRTRDMDVAKARSVRESMAGSICGLPCYVPNHLFCLVHNTVGGLQVKGNKDGPQQNPHPEGLALCSRELTPEEGGNLQGVNAFIAEQGAKEAAEHFGAEPVLPGVPMEGVDDAFKADIDFDFKKPAACPVPLPPFVCREHAEFAIGCRYCLAQSIVEGPLEPPMRLYATELSNPETWLVYPVASLPALLQARDTLAMELYVLASRWARKLVKE